jgi:peptidoglycan hydrolase-like protein with peptidoglycan-binding domain
MKTISKIAAIALVAVALVGVNTASAATVAELQAMIASLSAQIAALSGTPSTPAGVTFTSNLTVGSTGAEVTALQNFLIGKGYNTLATGYFGPMTKAALAAYQTAKGITPAVGYFGPLTRASVNGEAPVVVTPGTPSTGTGITTPGVEGTLTLTSSNSGLASSIYEGDDMVKVLGLKLEAKSSDISVQRVKIDLGDSTAIYNKILNKIYVMDGSTVLASSDLNSSTVVKDGSTYYITLTGFNALVKKDTSKVLTVAVDVKDSIDSTDASVSRTIRTADQAVRGVDGAGLDEYTGTVGISTKTFTVAATLVDSATLKTSLNTASPKATTIIASAGANQDEADKVTALIFNVKAEKDDILINELSVTASGTAVTDGDITTLYLFDGSTELDNATASTTGVTTFSNVDLTVSKDSTKTLTVKADIRGASSTARTLAVSINGDLSSQIDAENTVGDLLTSTYLSGSATGETMQVQKAGAVYTLVGTPSLSKSVIGQTASSTFLASFTVNVAAQGTEVVVGSTTAFAIGIFNGNTQLGSNIVATYEKPTTGITLDANGDYVIADGQSASFNVQTSFVAPNGSYVPAGAIVTARVVSATTDAGSVSYISDTFRTGSQTL